MRTIYFSEAGWDAQTLVMNYHLIEYIDGTLYFFKKSNSHNVLARTLEEWSRTDIDELAKFTNADAFSLYYDDKVLITVQDVHPELLI